MRMRVLPAPASPASKRSARRISPITLLPTLRGFFIPPRDTDHGTRTFSFNFRPLPPVTSHQSPVTSSVLVPRTTSFVFNHFQQWQFATLLFSSSYNNGVGGGGAPIFDSRVSAFSLFAVVVECQLLQNQHLCRARGGRKSYLRFLSTVNLSASSVVRVGGFPIFELRVSSFKFPIPRLVPCHCLWLA